MKSCSEASCSTVLLWMNLSCEDVVMAQQAVKIKWEIYFASWQCLRVSQRGSSSSFDQRITMMRTKTFLMLLLLHTSLDRNVVINFSILSI